MTKKIILLCLDYDSYGTFNYFIEGSNDETIKENDCQDGDVKLNKDGTPFIFWNDLWSPLCGHYFWENQYGATKFCQQLGYESGMHSGKPITKIYPVESFTLGKCLHDDEWPCCTGGENHFVSGRSLTNGTCAKSNDQAMVIRCFGASINVMNPSCNGKM